MLRFDRKQQNSAKQLSFNKKINKYFKILKKINKQKTNRLSWMKSEYKAFLFPIPLLPGVPHKAKKKHYLLQ